MTPCTTFAGGINPFRISKPEPMTKLQHLIMAGLKDHGPSRASELAKKMDRPVISVREILSRLEARCIIQKSGTRAPMYFFKEKMQ